jgi:signal recognition particle GTPase
MSELNTDEIEECIEYLRFQQTKASDQIHQMMRPTQQALLEAEIEGYEQQIELLSELLES